jgi:signal transduction histidine kinase
MVRYLRDRNFLSSRIALIFFSLCLPYYLVFDYLHLYFARFFVFPTALPALLALVLQRLGWSLSSKLTLILGTAACLFVAADILGPNVGMRVLLLTLLPLPFLLLEFSEKKWIFLSSGILFFVYFFMGKGYATPFVSPENITTELAEIIHRFVDVTTFLLLVLSAAAYFMSRHYDDVQIIGNTRDLEASYTNLAEKNHQLQTAYEDLQLQQNLLEKSWHDSVYAQLTRTIAHELKNPLFEFGMVIGALEKSLDDRETAMMFISSLATTIEELMQLVNAMLESGGASVGEYKEISISEVMNRVLILAEGSIKKRNIQLTKDISDIPPIMGDSKAFLMIFSNLIVNAMEAMEDGSTAALTVRVMADPEPQSGRQGVMVEISDTGVGIPKSRQEGLFKGGQSTKGIEERQRGIGLGLVWKLIDQMGGEITVHSDPDVRPGTMFLIVV